MIKQLYIVLSVLMGLSCQSAYGEYADHRNRHEDSLEVVLHSQQLEPKTKAKVLSDLMWGFLQTDGEKSKKYGWQLIEHAQKYDFALAESDAYRILGQHEYASGQHFRADSLFQCSQRAIEKMKALGTYTESDVDNMQSTLWGAIANNENVQGKSAEAIDHYEKMLNLLVKHNWKENQALLFYNIGELYLELKDLENATKNYQKAEEIAEATGDSLILAITKKGTVSLLIAQGEYGKALEESRQSLEYFQRHREERESENEVLTTQVEALEKINSQSRTINIIGYILVAALVCVVVMAFILMKQQKKRAESEKKLAEIKATIAGETEERTRLAKDLHDGIGSMLTAVRINLESFQQHLTDTMPADSLTQTYAVLDKARTELRRVAHHLMPDALQKSGLDAALSDFCKCTPRVNYFSTGYNPMDSEMEKMLYLVTHELVNNALKHANADNIEVQLLQDEQQISITVSDDGIGMSKETANNGMGLNNIKERIAVYSGRMSVDSVQNEGTEVLITLPYKEV